MKPAGWIEPHDAADVVHHLQASADVDRRSRDHPTLIHDRELGGAAADVDVEDALALVVRDDRGAGSVGGEHRLHVVSRRGADEVAASTAMTDAIVSAFSRRNASPVRITTPVSMSS